MAGIGISIGIARNSLGGAPVGASYLLDTYPAFAAYDVAFQLKADQTQMIEVREDGGGTFEWIAPSGGVLDETALLAHTGANNGYIRTTKDAQNTAATYDATQVTAADQLRIVSAGVVEKDNGYPAANSFDGTRWLSAPIAMPQPISIYMTYNRGGDLTLARNPYYGINDQLYYSTDSNDSTFIHRMVAGATLGTNSFAVGGQNTTEFIFNSTSSSIRVNNATATTGDAGTNGMGTALAIMSATGGVQGITGTLQQMIIFNSSTVTDGNDSSIRTAINDLYGVYV